MDINDSHSENSEQSDNEINDVNEDLNIVNVKKKNPKKGIIYLSTIPLYMNVTRIREFFEQFGSLGRIYMQLAETDTKLKESSNKKKKISKKFTEGWIEFERKSIAKKVAEMLNNKQVSTRKKSKQYDCIWNIKYLRGFKWTHLSERLAYEKAARRQKLRAEIQLAKKQTSIFTNNIGKKKQKKDIISENNSKINKKVIENDVEDRTNQEDRRKYLKSLFAS